MTKKESQKLNQPLELSERAVRFFYQNAPVGFQSLNEDGVLIEVNNAWLNTFGYSYDEVIGSPLKRFLVPGQQSRFDTNFIRLKHEKCINNAEYEIVTKSGEVVTISFSGKCIYDDNGEFVCTYCIFQNQTQLQETKDAFYESKRTARALIDTSDEPAFLMRTDGTFVYLNVHTARYAGKKVDDLRGKNAYDYMLPDIAESRRKIVAEVVERRTPKSFIDSSDGFVFDNYLNPITDASGNVKMLIVHSKDITKELQKKAQTEKLNELNNKLLKFGVLSDKLDMITQGILEIFDADFSRIWIRKSCDNIKDECAYFKLYNETQFCDQKDGCFHLISSSGSHSDRNDSLKRVPYGSMRIKKILTNNNDHLIIDNLLSENNDFDKEWVKKYGLKSFAGFALLSDQGQLIGILSLFTKKEIDSSTKQKISALANTTSHIVQAALKHEELEDLMLKQNEAVRASNVGLWDWDSRTNQVKFSPTWKKQIGYAEDELEDSSEEWRKRVHPDEVESVVKIIDDCVKYKKPGFQIEFRLRHKDGSYRNILSTASTLINEQGRVTRIVGSHIDLTEIKRIEKELRQANVTKDKFFSIIAHDLKGPIGGMLELSKLMIGDQENISGEARVRINNIMYKSLENVAGLLENLLTWSRAQRGLIELVPETIDISEYFDENISIVSQLATKKEIEIAIDVPENLYMHADLYTLSCVIRNLLSNAIKFTPRKGKITLGAGNCTNNSGMVEIWVEDNGVGMNEEQVHSIFDLGQNCSTKGTENELGSGLGLVLCEEFVVKNGGKIKVESELNKGSKFIYTVPGAK